MLNYVLGALALLSLVLTLWQWVVARRFPLHKRLAPASYFPPVTVLKPLRGFDGETASCLRSWLTQDYPGRTQILFGVASAEDPVCGIVSELIRSHPDRDAQLLLCSESLGANAKISTLIQLQLHARYHTLVVSDADVQAPAELLLNIVQPLSKPEVGLVHCFYRLANPTTLAMRWEATVTNADFWSQVLQARSLKPLDFALGAVMATRREELDNISGFRALADHLADDYRLGHLIAKNGRKIVICPIVVDCRSSPMRWGQVWSHQLRWARTIRVCQPVPYFFSILSNATLWPLVWFLLRPSMASLGIGVICLAVRLAVAANNQSRFTNSSRHLATLWLVLVKDLVQVALWILSFAGNRVYWQGEEYQVLYGGQLVKTDPLSLRRQGA